MLTSTVQALLTHVCQPNDYIKKYSNKITVVGAGTIGTAIAFSLLAQNLVEELVLIDQDEELARGEILDLQQATMFLENTKISASKNYTSSSDSRIVIVTAGGDAENNTEALVRSTSIFKDVIPKIAVHSPNAILIVATNPVDVLTYVAWKLSDFFPNRVIGYGTILQSARFRYLLADELGVSPNSLHAFVIGQQGSLSVPVWSGVSVSGVRLRDINTKLGTEDDPENWMEIHREVVESQMEVERLKSCGSWGIALGVTRIVKAILQDSKECFSVSTHVKGCRHGVDKDVFLSLPCIIGSEGVFTIVKQSLSEQEKDLLQQSADSMNELQNKLQLY